MERVVLTIEILSPSTTSVDRGRKRRLYGEEGVAEYWIVDPKRRQIEVWRTGVSSMVTYAVPDTLQWHAPGTSVALDVVLAALFGVPSPDR